MEKTEKRILIIGGGIAGLTAAAEVRKNSEEAEIIVFSGEELSPYYRLNLIRYLSKEADRDSLFIYPESWYEEKRIRFLSGKKVEKVLPNEKKVFFRDGETYDYDKLILANGAYPFIPPIKGAGLENVITVRSMADADFIISHMEKLDSCICIGAGILGLEVAGAIAKNGVTVTMLENAPWLMPKQLDKKASEKLKKALLDLGIHVKEGVRAEEILGKTACEGVKLDSGEILEGKLVIVTAGVRPDIELALQMGLKTEDGVIVDDRMETSVKDVFAAGDVTQHEGICYGLWTVAQMQGKVAALNALGMESEFHPVPRSNVLKVLGIDLFSAGVLEPTDENCIVQELDEPQKFVRFILKDEKIIGSIVYGDKPLSLKVKFAMDKGKTFSEEEYVNTETLIKKLLG